MNKLILAGLICGSVGVANALASVIVAPLPAGAPNLVGKPMPTWNIPRALWMNTSKPIAPSSLRGKLTVIEFFRVDCSHCQAAVASRRALFLKYQSRGVNFIGFHSPGSGPDESNWPKVQSVVRGWKVPYPVAFDANRALFNKCKLQLFPTVLVVDGTGVVRFQQSGFDARKAKALEGFIAPLTKPLTVRVFKTAKAANRYLHGNSASASTDRGVVIRPPLRAIR